MKKTILALFASACALGASALEIKDDAGRSFEYSVLDGDAVELVSITPRIKGSELDLADVQKLFSSEGLRITQIENPADLVEDTSAITSVVLPEYFESRLEVRELLSLPNVEAVYGGGDAITAIDGLAYAEGGRVLVRCPTARAGAVKLPENCRQLLPYAFAGCRNLTGVSGGAEVLRVGSCAFGDLSEPGELAAFVANLPDGVVMVGGAVLGWKGSNVPETIELPAGATSVADCAFPESVTNVIGGSGVMWVGQEAFEGYIWAQPSGELVMVGNVLIGCRGGIVPTLTPPANTVAIAPGAFAGYNAIVELDFAGLTKLEVIGANAFERCHGLGRAGLPACVKEIQTGAFNTCDMLSIFTFGAGTESIGYGVFDSCPNLKDVYFHCELAPREDCDVSYDFQSAFYKGTLPGLVTHVRRDSTGWKLDDNGKWCQRKIEFDQKRSVVTGYVGHYGKWPLAKLGVSLPPAGTVYSVVAYGLPKGLVLKTNAVKKNKKGKVVTPAKTSWWIEGVPATTLDCDCQTAFVKTTVNGHTSLQPLAFEVVEPELLECEFPLNAAIVKRPVDLGLGAGWTLSGLPKGLLQAKKALTAKIDSKKRAVTAYGVYGKPTVPGNRIVTAKKKKGSWYEVRKLRFRVLNADGTPVEDPPEVPVDPVGLDFNGGDGERVMTIQGGLQEDGGEAVIHEFTADPGASLALTGAPDTLRLVEDPEGSGSWKLVGFAPPGYYHVSVTASLDGCENVRQSVILHSDALPDWAAGSFSGYVAAVDNMASLQGYFTMSVTAKGAISGKLARDGQSYVFTADSYTSCGGEGSMKWFSTAGIVLKQYATLRVYDKAKKKYVYKKALVDSGKRLDITVNSGVAGILSGVMDDGQESVANVFAQQNRWGNLYKSVGATLFTASAKQKYKTFKVSGGCGLPDGASLAFKITTSGAVTVTGTFPTGRKRVKKNGRWVYVTTYANPVASTTVLPGTAPEFGAAGFRGRIAVHLSYGSGNSYCRIFDFPFEVEGRSWHSGEFNTLAYVDLPTASESVGQAFGVRTVGTCNVKVKESFAFTGTFTPEGADTAVTFSGTFKPSQAAPTEGGAYEATATLLWKGWTIPFTITLEKDVFENREVGHIWFYGQSAAGASFASMQQPASTHDLWTFPDQDSAWLYDRTWPDMYEEADMGNYRTSDDDYLTYRFCPNGRVLIEGVIDGRMVKASSVVMFNERSNDGFDGCFFVNLGVDGLFVQKCTITVSDTGGKITADGEFISVLAE